MPRPSKINNQFLKNGVAISPAIPSAGENVKVLYDGLLSKNGAGQIFARIGYGSKWDGLRDYEMTKTRAGFEATIPIIPADRMNVCFKDSAGNWDNNANQNYIFDIVQ